jgi:hypothetical protein
VNVASASINFAAILKGLLSGITASKVREIFHAAQDFIIQAEKVYPAKGTGTQKFDWVEDQLKEAFSTIWEKNGTHFLDFIIQLGFSALSMAGKV